MFSLQKTITETNSNKFTGLMETCKFISWSILARLINTVQRNCNDANIFLSMLGLYRGFDPLNVNDFECRLFRLLQILRILFFLYLRVKNIDWLIDWLIILIFWYWSSIFQVIRFNYLLNRAIRVTIGTSISTHVTSETITVFSKSFWHERKTWCTTHWKFV